MTLGDRSVRHEGRTSTTLRRDMAEPFFSVAVPCWNVGATLRDQLDAIFEQVVDEDAEVIVIDDHSDDDTATVAAQWADEHPDAAIAVLRAPRRGGPKPSRNIGALVARGTWIVNVDGDDLVLPGWFEALSQCVRSAPDTTIVTGIVVHPDGTRSAPTDFDGSPTVFGGNMAISRQTLLSCSGFDESMFRGGTETEFVLRAQRSWGLSVVGCDQSAIFYRHPTKESPIRLRARRQLQRVKGHSYLEHRLQLEGARQGKSALWFELISSPLTALARITVSPGTMPRSTHLRVAVSKQVRLFWLAWFQLTRPRPRLMDPNAVDAYTFVHRGPLPSDQNESRSA